MSARNSFPVAIIGAGDVGIDLLLKISGSDGPLVVAAVVGSGADVHGLDLAARVGVPTTSSGIDGLRAMPHFSDVRLAFVTVAGDVDGLRTVDLNSSPTGRICVPAVPFDDDLTKERLNMVTGGAQAGVPIVAAVAQSGIVSYAEIVSAIPAGAVGSEARASLDDTNESTSAAAQVVGGALRAKSLTVLSPATPPTAMRNTVYCLVDGDVDRQQIEADVAAMIDRVRTYAPGYSLRQRLQFESFSSDDPLRIPETGKFVGTRVTALLEVRGAADHLPAYAGNLDIVTAAAQVTAERIAVRQATSVGLSA